MQLNALTGNSLFKFTNIKFYHARILCTFITKSNCKVQEMKQT